MLRRGGVVQHETIGDASSPVMADDCEAGET
jgi:hypothetical protein